MQFDPDTDTLVIILGIANRPAKMANQIMQRDTLESNQQQSTTFTHQ